MKKYIFVTIFAFSVILNAAAINCGSKLSQCLQRAEYTYLMDGNDSGYSANIMHCSAMHLIYLSS